jgi:hypothetical protein
VNLDCSDLVAANVVECREPASSSTCTPRLGCVRYVRASWRLPRAGHRQFLSVDPVVDGTGTPYVSTGVDPVNEAIPTG